MFKNFICNVSHQLPGLSEYSSSTLFFTVSANVLEVGPHRIVQLVTTSLFITQFQICKNLTKLLSGDIVAFALDNHVSCKYS
jgi:hypothetical protein